MKPSRLHALGVHVEHGDESGPRRAERPRKPGYGAADVDAPPHLWHLPAVDLFALRRGLVRALLATLLTVACRSPSPSAPSPTPVVTVAAPAPSAKAPPAAEPEKPPCDQLLALQAVFAGGTPEPPCPAE
ncbi:MAG: hypothetical protein JW751_25045 [Polyangiaceae bacterium]|nr:hypothetical protein [Polyangiaceae bacterium]